MRVWHYNKVFYMERKRDLIISWQYEFGDESGGNKTGFNCILILVLLGCKKYRENNLTWNKQGGSLVIYWIKGHTDNIQCFANLILNNDVILVYKSPRMQSCLHAWARWAISLGPHVHRGIMLI